MHAFPSLCLASRSEQFSLVPPSSSCDSLGYARSKGILTKLSRLCSPRRLCCQPQQALIRVQGVEQKMLHNIADQADGRHCCCCRVYFAQWRSIVHSTALRVFGRSVCPRNIKTIVRITGELVLWLLLLLLRQ